MRNIWSGAIGAGARKRKVVFIVAGVFLAANAVLVWRLPDVRLGKLQLTAIGADGTAVLVSPTPVVGEPHILNSQVLRLTLPGAYEQRDAGVDTSSFLEHYRFFDTGGSGVRRVTLTVKETSAADMSELPGVRLRRHRSDEYEEENIMVDGRSGIEFTKPGISFERVVFFWQPPAEGRPGLEITLSTTASLGAAQDMSVSEEYETILSSLQWR